VIIVGEIRDITTVDAIQKARDAGRLVIAGMRAPEESARGSLEEFGLHMEGVVFISASAGIC
jgi:type II secretory ATPase GspE/PulE/Tfp pilus assembly ATPase PilB-like protein